MKVDENPFERWEVDPESSRQELTSTLKERSRRLDPQGRQSLQQDWRRLTTDELFRAQALLRSHHRRPASDPLDLAERLCPTPKAPPLPPLQPNLEDALVLPSMSDEEIFAHPPFLPFLPALDSDQ